MVWHETVDSFRYWSHHMSSHSLDMHSNIKITFLIEISAHQRPFLSAKCASAWMDRSTSVCHQRKCKHNPLFDQENACQTPLARFECQSISRAADPVEAGILR
jgi:hypothetical protein